MPDEPIQPVVDMDEYDAAMVEAGYEFDDDEPEEPEETDVTFLTDGED